MAPQIYAAYRSQGTSTGPRVVNIQTASTSSTESNVSSESESDGPPPLQSMARPVFPPRGLVVGTTARLEQYLVVVFEGERLFFRITITLERGAGSVRPHVTVMLVNGIVGDASVDSEAWIIFSLEMESALLRELERAFNVAEERRRRDLGGRLE
ncbi:hypothetical protein L226DRAFT_522158 [Lentinus tigrinus ALCF2SS1-7]|uniref:Uncharacterized protein n=1 Tax=Lentinus tigrinus ALCF2SS1-6 TaxID=1328759 RepID=A0A5C2SM93_9APHY|nr:hypothetical protein L227DRAFT_561077 [Lentinus tigrinus ALCF2SS1-6]RPD76618.1 hypothetical protein L226DRAFT_522158 [Lentinus tigrinus ALCF2SS1-7]